MNQPNAINIRRLVITAAVLVLITTALLFWARDVVREVVVIPLSYLFWVLRILVRTTPQIFFWIATLLIVCMIAYHSLSARKKLAAPRQMAVDDLPASHMSGRAVFWANKVNLLRAGQGGFMESNFHAAVIRLLVEMLSYRYRLPARAIEDQVLDGSIDVPPQVKAYMHAHLVQVERPPVRFLTRMWQSILAWARPFLQKLSAEPAGSKTVVVDAQLAFILKYMEEELEVLHDDSGR